MVHRSLVRASRGVASIACVLVIGAVSLVACAHADAPTGSAGSTGSTGGGLAPGALGTADDAAAETMQIAPPPDSGAVAQVIATPAASPAPGAATMGATGDGAGDPAFFACHADADCTAVRKNGCCNHGELEAVATSQVAAYKASFTCKAHAMCSQYLRRDLRVPACDTAASRCQMVPPGAAAGAPPTTVQTNKRSSP